MGMRLNRKRPNSLTLFPPGSGVRRESVPKARADGISERGPDRPPSRDPSSVHPGAVKPSGRRLLPPGLPAARQPEPPRRGELALPHRRGTAGGRGSCSLQLAPSSPLRCPGAEAGGAGQGHGLPGAAGAEGLWERGDGAPKLLRGQGQVGSPPYPRYSVTQQLLGARIRTPQHPALRSERGRGWRRGREGTRKT